QTRLWSAGFIILILLITGCGYLLWGTLDRASPTAAGPVDAAPPAWRDVISWVGLAAVPSGLLIAVTAHISTDVAAVPLLWVIPLALYLATFVIVFQTRPVLPHRWMVNAGPAFVILLVAVLAFGGLDYIFLTM